MPWARRNVDAQMFHAVRHAHDLCSPCSWSGATRACTLIFLHGRGNPSCSPFFESSRVPKGGVPQERWRVGGAERDTGKGIPSEQDRGHRAQDRGQTLPSPLRRGRKEKMGRTGRRVLVAPQTQSLDLDLDLEGDLLLLLDLLLFLRRLLLPWAPPGIPSTHIHDALGLLRQTLWKQTLTCAPRRGPSCPCPCPCPSRLCHRRYFHPLSFASACSQRWQEREPSTLER